MHLINSSSVVHLVLIAIEAAIGGFLAYLLILFLLWLSIKLFQWVWGSTRHAQRQYALRYEQNKGVFDLRKHLVRQIAFSSKAFGGGYRSKAIVDHIKKELAEIEADPYDLKEWIDVILLGLDGAWRSSHTPEQICSALAAKLEENEKRTWPDWRTADPDKAIEHINGYAPSSTENSVMEKEAAHEV